MSLWTISRDLKWFYSLLYFPSYHCRVGPQSISRCCPTFPRRNVTLQVSRIQRTSFKYCAQLRGTSLLWAVNEKVVAVKPSCPVSWSLPSLPFPLFFLPFLSFCLSLSLWRQPADHTGWRKMPFHQVADIKITPGLIQEQASWGQKWDNFLRKHINLEFFIFL